MYKPVTNYTTIPTNTGTNYDPDEVYTQRLGLPPGWYQPTVYNNHWLLASYTPPGDEIVGTTKLVQEVREELQGFLASEPKYTAYKLSHKRGVLLYGPPGTGKTTIARQIAGEVVELGGLAIPITDEHRFSIAVGLVKAQEPGRPAVFIIEDIEEYIDDPGILAILDGEESLANVIFIALTNEAGKLPPRITNRPGRFDRVEYIGALGPEIQLAYLQAVEARVPTGPKVAAELVAALSKVQGVTIAHLREAFAAKVILGASTKEVTARITKMIAGTKKE